MVRYLLEDTPLIPFLINNKPQLIEQIQEVVSEAKSEADKQTEISDNAV